MRSLVYIKCIQDSVLIDSNGVQCRPREAIRSLGAQKQL